MCGMKKSVMMAHGTKGLNQPKQNQRRVLTVYDGYHPVKPSPCCVLAVGLYKTKESGEYKACGVRHRLDREKKEGRTG